MRDGLIAFPICLPRNTDHYTNSDFMTKRLAFLFLVLVFSNLNAQQRDSVALYLDSALQVMQSNSLFSDRVNWQETRQRQGSYKTYKEADSVLVQVFSRLRDKHGFIATNDTFYRYSEPEENRFSEGILREYRKPRSIRISMLEERIGYYKMPAVLIGSDTAKMKSWANALYDSLCKLMSSKPVSLVLDLRMNNGGNSVPMFESMRPLLGPYAKTYLANSRFEIVEPETTALSEAYEHAGKPDRKCTKENLQIRIAVLIGPGTASSGEILAMAFASRPGTRLFGEKSAGVCNSTNGFLLTMNSFYTLLTENYVADFRKKINTSQVIIPDVYIKSQDNYDDPSSDITVQMAMKWLKESK